MASNFVTTVVSFVTLIAIGKSAAASSYKVLFTFDGKNGSYPVGRLLLDSAGNLYGTTAYGGAHGMGTVYRLSPPGAGQSDWQETVLHSFNGKDGHLPLAGLVGDASGNLYGTTGSGGVSANKLCGCGTVFKLAPPATGSTVWKETVLYAFSVNPSIENPYDSLTFDSAGRLYGTGATGGYGRGGVFRLVPSAKGKTGWSYENIYLFRAKNSPLAPNSEVVIDQNGNLFGTSYRGGPSSGCGGAGCGDVYKLSPPKAGTKAWTETEIFDFNGKNGWAPIAGLALTSDGRLFGTTYFGAFNPNAVGNVFELTPPTDNSGTYSYIQVAALTRAKGGVPQGTILPDSDGNLYLAAGLYGPKVAGSILMFTPPATPSGSWKQNIIFDDFSLFGPGQNAGLIMDKNGTLYGVTGSNAATGGTLYGSVYAISP